MPQDQLQIHNAELFPELENKNSYPDKKPESKFKGIASNEDLYDLNSI